MAIAVLVVLLVGAAVSLGMFTPRSSRADLHGATNFLLDQVEFARAGATMRNQAFELTVDSIASPQQLVIRNYQGTHCMGTAVPVREIEFTSALDGPSGWPGGGDGAPRFPEVTVIEVTPNDLTGLCFRPDGRVTHPDGRVIEPLDPASPFAAGEASIALRLRVERDSPLAITHRVVISYNGIAKIEYEVP